MRKAWIVWLMVWSLLLVGTTAYAAPYTAQPGLLRWQPGVSESGGYQYGATDGNPQTFITVSNEPVVWTFPRPVDLTGFIFYADSPDAQLYLLDVNGTEVAAAGAYTTEPTAPFPIQMSAVKSLRVKSAKPANAVRVYELDVYGKVSAIAPGVPTSLRANGMDRTVQLDWRDSQYALGYRVKRSMTPGGPYSVVQTVYGTTYADKSVMNGYGYYYVVSAFNEFGESGNSDPAYAVPYLPVPSTPASLSAYPGDGQVMLQWPTVTGAVYYNVKRAVWPGGGFTTVAQTVYGYYTDTSAANGVTYAYTVSAMNASGESGPSIVATAMPVAPQPDRAMLVVTLTDRLLKEYDVSLQEAEAFAAWYAAGPNGPRGPVFTIDRSAANKGPYSKRLDYIAYASVVSFEINAYRSR
ncbi:fibronectin type III domain-containing protein [Paenibacillus hodogayensis]|uniref:Fibronectin type III domain-containing protein n=1 Tax=Paenibacillus hodogayensis TaxID=279208 RepID=A0ABV5W4Z4_9BACL